MPPRIESPERSISAPRTAIATNAAPATASRTAPASAPVRRPPRRGVRGRPLPRRRPGASSSAKPQRAQRPAPARTSAPQRGQLGVAATGPTPGSAHSPASVPPQRRLTIADRVAAPPAGVTSATCSPPQRASGAASARRPLSRRAGHPAALGSLRNETDRIAGARRAHGGHLGRSRSPTVYHVAGFLAGVALELASPTPGIRIAVAVLAVGARLALDGAATLNLRRAGTSMVPMNPTTALVTSGPHRLTRNPIYLGMAFLYVAFAFALGVIWAPAFPPAVLVIIDRFVIAREEPYLERKFGQAYRDRKARVRRWLQSPVRARREQLPDPRAGARSECDLAPTPSARCRTLVRMRNRPCRRPPPLPQRRRTSSRPEPCNAPKAATWRPPPPREQQPSSSVTTWPLGTEAVA
jgi:protein-S-isoprenylcysteine O-methyltransferase Ste14